MVLIKRCVRVFVLVVELVIYSSASLAVGDKLQLAFAFIIYFLPSLKRRRRENTTTSVICEIIIDAITSRTQSQNASVFVSLLGNECRTNYHPVRWHLVCAMITFCARIIVNFGVSIKTFLFISSVPFVIVDVGFCNFLVISELGFIFIVRIVCAGVLYFGMAFFSHVKRALSATAVARSTFVSPFSIQFAHVGRVRLVALSSKATI